MQRRKIQISNSKIKMEEHGKECYCGCKTNLIPTNVSRKDFLKKIIT